MFIFPKEVGVSHFCVLVFSDDVERDLAPFQENNMGDCPRKYLAFFDKTDEVKETWEKYEDKYENSIEKFARKYHGYVKTDDGKFGYWENPNAKWDWYQVGGRYKDRLVTKDGKVCDEARLDELDLKSMLKQRQQDYAETYDEAARHGHKMDFIYGIQKGESKADYVARARPLGCFAVLFEGQWYERA